MNWKLYHVTTSVGKYLALGLTEEVVRENVGTKATLVEVTPESMMQLRLAGEREHVLICL